MDITHELPAHAPTLPYVPEQEIRSSSELRAGRPRVQQVLACGGSRVSRREFTRSLMAGAAAGLIARPASAGEVGWLGDVSASPSSVPADAPKVAPLLVSSGGDPITQRDQWLARRKELRKWWLEYLGPLPGSRERVPKLTVVEEDRVGGVIRQRVRYEIELGFMTEAYLLRPAKISGKAPGVAVFHSTVNHSIRQPAGVEGKPEKAFGLKLAQRGCVTFSPRNYLWPDNDHIAAGEEAERFLKRHPKSKGMAKMLLDSLVAVDILCSLPEVDTTRIGSVGHSLGAKEVLYLAAFDERVKVTVSSEGGVSTTFSNWDAPWYLSKAIRQVAPHEHHELLGLAAPRPFLLIGGDSADGDQSWPLIEAALPVYRLFGEPPRLGLYNHKQGHAVPPQAERKIYEWFDAYL